MHKLMETYQAEIEAELTNENLYSEWEQAIDEENVEVAVKIKNELEGRGIEMSNYIRFLPLHKKAILNV